MANLHGCQILLLLVVLLNCHAFAGQVTVQILSSFSAVEVSNTTASATQANNSTTKVNTSWDINGIITVQNRGEEPVYNIQVEVTFPDGKKLLPIISTLVAGSETKFAVNHKSFKLNPGRYPIIIFADYMDATEYPSSALLVTHLFLGEARFPMVFGSIPATHISSKGELYLKLKNLDDQPKSLSITVVLPRGIHLANRDLKRLVLEPYKKSTIKFPVKNDIILPGSAFPAYVIMEYDQGLLHHSAVASCSLMVRDKGALHNYRIYLIVGGSLLLVIGALLNILGQNKILRQSKRSKEQHAS